MIISIITIIFLIMGILELKHFFRERSPLIIKPYDWKFDSLNNSLKITGFLKISNPHSRIEVMVPNIYIKPIFLGSSFSNNLKVNKKIYSLHDDEANRDDNYWKAYILKSKKSTNILIEFDVVSPSGIDLSEEVESAWIDIKWDNYGPFGLINRKDGFVVRNKNKSLVTNSVNWLKLKDNISILPIKTHILGILDNPYEVLINYISKHIKPGDTITIGESPLAIMQGRYLFPSNIKVTTLAKIICRGFHPTSSLATACGMQVLINIVGPTRVIYSFIIGGLFKLINIKGIFYRLAGSQACLIDDITGTTPPYDQTIVLGPKYSQTFCENAQRDLGIEVAVVDVNDLGRVKIIASSKNCNRFLIQEALTSNPAGNADQRTPLVLVRPSKDK